MRHRGFRVKAVAGPGSTDWQTMTNARKKPAYDYRSMVGDRYQLKRNSELRKLSSGLCMMAACQKQ
jgi:hypothetical protein